MNQVTNNNETLREFLTRASAQDDPEYLLIRNQIEEWADYSNYGYGMTIEGVLNNPAFDVIASCDAMIARTVFKVLRNVKDRSKLITACPSYQRQSICTHAYKSTDMIRYASYVKKLTDYVAFRRGITDTRCLFPSKLETTVSLPPNIMAATNSNSVIYAIWSLLHALAYSNIEQTDPFVVEFVNCIYTEIYAVLSIACESYQYSDRTEVVVYLWLDKLLDVE